MTLISIRKLKKSFGDLEVLRDVSFDVGEGDRIGLVGGNGAGKTTLANIVFGSMEPDEGTVMRYRPDMKTGYLMQSTSYTVNLFNGMLIQGEADGPMDEFLETASHLGLKKVQEWDLQKFGGLSGGEKTKLALAHIWVSRPDLLILDEPTNHLDFHGVEWLVNELDKFHGTVIIISHDRYFLDRTVKQIVELEDGSVSLYPGNYTFYREEKKRRYESQLHQYNTQKKYEQKIEAEIERLTNWSSKAHREAGKVGKMAEMRTGVKEFYRAKAKKMDKQIKSRIKRLERIEMEGVEKPKEEAKIYFDFGSPEKRGRRIVEVNRLAKAFGDKVLFRSSSFYIGRGEKVGLVGPNGCGKTTFVRMLLGEVFPDQGEIWVSPSAKIAYLSQDVTDLNPERTALELLQGDREQISRARTLLANMGFDESMLKKPIGLLSLGERTRIKIANLILRETDVLILDEPTNHLDLPSREQLEQTLSDYEGTLLLISHDRYMLERICEKLLVFDGSQIRKIESGFKEYMEASSSSSRKKSSKDNREHLKEQIMVIENRISFLLGELSRHTPGDPQYEALDAEFKQLVQKKKELAGRG